MADGTPWMIVMLDNGVYQLASTQSVPQEALNPGSIVMVSDCDGETRAAKVVALSNDRHTVEQQMQSLEMNTAQSSNGRVTLEIIDEPEGDNSSSGSSWAPDPHSATDSESEIPLKKIKTEPVKSYPKQKRKKQRRPTLRPDPILPQHWTPKRAHNENAELQSFTSIENGRNNHTDSPHKFVTPNTSHQSNSKHKSNSKIILIDASELNWVKSEMTVIRNIVQKLKSLSSNIKGALPGTQEDNGHSQPLVTSDYSIERLTPDMGGFENDNVTNDHSQEAAMTTNTKPRVNTPYVDKSVRSNLREKFNRKQNIEASGQSGSKNNSVKKHKPIKILNVSGGYESENNDMVPIGSGKTLVPKDIYDKINWKSYTMATRKLLMAVFPRRTLATHSLTGKASPAFLTKPAKLCLDPKKVSDIVMTVTANCHVKEGLVRSAITTKCADENKMLKQQMQKDQRQRSLEASALHKEFVDSENNRSPKPDKH